MKTHSMDLETEGEDYKTGWGLPILPKLSENDSENKKEEGNKKEEKEEIPVVENKKKTEFTDVPAGAWYEDAVAECVKRGIVNGMGDGTFAPNQILTRAQVCQIALNIINVIENK